MQFDNIINKFLKEEETSKDDKLSALKSLRDNKTYHVVHIGHSRDLSYVVKVTETQSLSLEDAVKSVEQDYIKAIEKDYQDESMLEFGTAEEFIKDWVFSRVVPEDDLGYVNEGEESGWIIIGQRSTFWSNSGNYNDKASSLNEYINRKFF